MLNHLHRMTEGRIQAEQCRTSFRHLPLEAIGLSCDYRSQVRNKVLGSSLSQRRDHADADARSRHGRVLCRPAPAHAAAHAGQSEHAKQDKHQSDG